MDAKIMKLFGLDKITPEARKAAEMAFNEAVYCEKNRRYYGLAQNIDGFISAIGAQDLPKDEKIDLVEKTKLVVEHLAHHQTIDENLIVPLSQFKWTKSHSVPNFGLTSRSRRKQ